MDVRSRTGSDAALKGRGSHRSPHPGRGGNVLPINNANAELEVHVSTDSPRTFVGMTARPLTEWVNIIVSP